MTTPRGTESKVRCIYSDGSRRSRSCKMLLQGYNQSVLGSRSPLGHGYRAAISTPGAFPPNTPDPAHNVLADYLDRVCRPEENPGGVTARLYPIASRTFVPLMNFERLVYPGPLVTADTQDTKQICSLSRPPPKPTHTHTHPECPSLTQKTLLRI